MAGRGLDPGSRVMLSELVRISWILGLFGCGGWVAGFIPSQEVMGRFGLLFSLGGIYAMNVAARRRERLGHGPLNHWDECMALNAIALLFSIAQRLSLGS